MPIPRSMRKKIEQAIKAIEDRNNRNNYLILKPSQKPQDIPKLSLVIQLTGYDQINPPEPTGE